jgi:hypothetical protein
VRNKFLVNFWNCTILFLYALYIPRNGEFGSAFSKLRNFGGGLTSPTPSSVHHWPRVSKQSKEFVDKQICKYAVVIVSVAVQYTAVHKHVSCQVHCG